MNTRIKKLYGGIEVYSPDEKLMFRCNEKKKNWYLSRNLAIPYKDQSILLTFNPNGNGDHKDILSIPRLNKCVQCGEEEISILTKHHIVPHNFMKFININGHKSWLLVPLCKNCHFEYEEKALELKKELCRNNNIAECFNNQSRGDYIYIKNLEKAISKEDDENLIGYMTKKITQRIANFEKKHNISYYDYNINLEKEYSQQIVEIINDDNKIMSIWIEHFLANMSLPFLPQEHKTYLSSKK
jgi:hypothetical protein